MFIHYIKCFKCYAWIMCVFPPMHGCGPAGIPQKS
jgi:hypothetical protein